MSGFIPIDPAEQSNTPRALVMSMVVFMLVTDWAFAGCRVSQNYRVWNSPVKSSRCLAQPLLLLLALCWEVLGWDLPPFLLFVVQRQMASPLFSFILGLGAKILPHTNGRFSLRIKGNAHLFKPGWKGSGPHRNRCAEWWAHPIMLVEHGTLLCSKWSGNPWFSQLLPEVPLDTRHALTSQAIHRHSLTHIWREQCLEQS